jgi:DNA-binding transcriptional regulator GbsR (MarR family)
MKNKRINLRDLANSVGDFIRYWGFRRIHGQIWTLIYLSERPLNGAQIVKLLGVSKALVSPALKELEDYKLILSEKLDGRTYIYRANPDVFGVIREILTTRESKLIDKAFSYFQALVAHADAEKLDGAPLPMDPERLKALGEMISSAKTILALFLSAPSA